MKDKLYYKNFLLKKMRVFDISLDYLKWFKFKTELRFIENKNIHSLTNLKNFVKKNQNKDTIIIGVFNKNNKHIGNIKFDNINRNDSSCYLGIIIGDKKYRGKGYSKNIIFGAIKLLKKNFNIDYVYLGVNQNNMRARIAFFNSGFNFYKKKNKKIIMRFNV